MKSTEGHDLERQGNRMDVVVELHRTSGEIVSVEVRGGGCDVVSSAGYVEAIAGADDPPRRECV